MDKYEESKIRGLQNAVRTGENIRQKGSDAVGQALDSVCDRLSGITAVLDERLMPVCRMPVPEQKERERAEVDRSWSPLLDSYMSIAHRMNSKLNQLEAIIERLEV